MSTAVAGARACGPGGPYVSWSLQRVTWRLAGEPATPMRSVLGLGDFSGSHLHLHLHLRYAA